MFDKRSAAFVVAASVMFAAGGSRAAEPDEMVLAACRPAGAGCSCSFASMETDLSFTDAAGAVLTYYQRIRDDRFPLLLDQLLRQCVGEAVPEILFPQTGPPLARSASVTAPRRP